MKYRNKEPSERPEPQSQQRLQQARIFLPFKLCWALTVLTFNPLISKQCAFPQRLRGVRAGLQPRHLLHEVLTEARER